MREEKIINIYHPKITSAKKLKASILKTTISKEVNVIVFLKTVLPVVVFKFSDRRYSLCKQLNAK